MVSASGVGLQLLGQGGRLIIPERQAAWPGPWPAAPLDAQLQELLPASPGAYTWAGTTL